MGVRHQQLFNEVFIFHRGGRLAPTAPALGLVIFHSLGLGIAAVGNGDYQIFLVDEVGNGEVTAGAGDFGAALIAVIPDNLFQLVTDHLQQALRLAQNLQQVGDFLEDILVFVLELFGLQAGQAVQAQIQDRLRLFRRQMVQAITQAVDFRQIVGAAGVFAGPFKHGQHIAGRPALGHQLLFGFVRGRRRLDQLDDFIDVGQSHGEAFEDMTTLPCLAQFVNRPTGHDFAAVPQEGIQHFLEVQRLRLAVDQRHHIDTEHGLKLGVGKQVIDHHIRILAPAQLDHHPDTFLVGFVPKLGNALDPLLLDQLGDLLDQPGLVELVRQLGNDDGFATGFLVLLDLVAGPDVDAAAAGAVRLDNTGTAIDDALGREVRPRNMLHQLVDGQIRVIDQCQTAVHDFGQVVRRNVGRHTDSDARGTVHQQVGHSGRQHLRNTLGAVVVIHEIDGFLVQIGQQRVGDLFHPDFGVTHGGGVVAVDGTEVTLTIHQRVTQGERLGHPNDGVVDRRITVRMVFTDNITDHTGRFFVRLVPVVAQFGHGEQHPPVHRLEAIPNVRQGPPHDDAHGVIEVRLLQLVFNVYRQDLFG